MSSARGALAPFDIAGMLASAQEGRPKGLLDVMPEPGLRGLLGQMIYDAANSAGLGSNANRMRNEASAIMDLIPGVGEAVGADDARRSFNAGNYGQAAFDTGTTLLGAIPGGGDLAAGVAKAIFGGIGAKTADKGMLDLATAMASKGSPRDAIWNETGWFQGPDDQWRFEIDDSKSRLGTKALEELMAGPAGASGATQRSAPGTIWHDDLYKAYPELRTVDIDARYNTALSNPNGSFVAGAQYNGGRPRIDIQANSLEGDRNSVRGIGLHEMQHGVQSIEGFVDGANDTFGHKKDDVWLAAKAAYEDSVGLGADAVSEDEILAELLGRPFEKKPAKAWDDLTEREKVAWLERGRGRLYSRNAGEVEARNVQTRMNMTAAERRATPPWATQDVPDELQIVRRR